MNMPKISIIIPMYNIRPYLARCIESCISQSLREIEIIIVDDCGNDGATEIAKAYAKLDSRIRIIHNEKNLGTFGARIVGVKHAQGTYICFLDGDDFLESKACERAYQAVLDSVKPVEHSAFGNHWLDSKNIKCYPKGFTKLPHTSQATSLASPDFLENQQGSATSAISATPHPHTSGNVIPLGHNLSLRDNTKSAHCHFERSEKSRLDSKDVADSVICRPEHNKAFCRPERAVATEVSHHIKSSKDSSFALQTENDKSIDSNKDALYATNMRTIVKDFAKTCKHDKVDSINRTRDNINTESKDTAYMTDSITFNLNAIPESELPDIVFFGMRFEPKTFKRVSPPVITKTLYYEEILYEVFAHCATPPWHICAKLYKASHIMRTVDLIVAHMGDDVRLTMAEDVLKSFWLCALAKKSIGIKDKLYVYCDSQASITRKIDIATRDRKINDISRVVDELHKLSNVPELRVNKAFDIAQNRASNILKSVIELEHRYDGLLENKGGAGLYAYLRACIKSLRYHRKWQSFVRIFAALFTLGKVKL